MRTGLRDPNALVASELLLCRPSHQLMLPPTLVSMVRSEHYFKSVSVSVTFEDVPLEVLLFIIIKTFSGGWRDDLAGQIIGGSSS